MLDTRSNQEDYASTAWKSFEVTGSISDYLLYCNIKLEETPSQVAESNPIEG